MMTAVHMDYQVHYYLHHSVIFCVIRIYNLPRNGNQTIIEAIKETPD